MLPNTTTTIPKNVSVPLLSSSSLTTTAVSSSSSTPFIPSSLSVEKGQATVIPPSSSNPYEIRIPVTGEELDNIELIMERQYNQQLTKQMEVSILLDPYYSSLFHYRLRIHL